MFFAICIGEYGIISLVGRGWETRELVLENFANAWAQFQQSNAYAFRDGKVNQYGIAQVVDGVVMTAPPQFEIVPVINLLEKPKAAQ